MNENRIMQQINAIFSVFMVFFYLGIGIYLLFFFKNTVLDRSAMVIFGSVLLFYGVYRAFRAYVILTELFRKNSREETE